MEISSRKQGLLSQHWGWWKRKFQGPRNAQQRLYITGKNAVNRKNQVHLLKPIIFTACGYCQNISGNANVFLCKARPRVIFKHAQINHRGEQANESTFPHSALQRILTSRFTVKIELPSLYEIKDLLFNVPKPTFLRSF